MTHSVNKSHIPSLPKNNPSLNWNENNSFSNKEKTTMGSLIKYFLGNVSVSVHTFKFKIENNNTLTFDVAYLTVFIPSSMTSVSKGCLGGCFVKTSAIISPVVTYFKMIPPSCTPSLTKWWRISMLLVPAWTTGSFASAIPPSVIVFIDYYGFMERFSFICE